ncbi:hypothetical protein BV22DRAFT_1083499 [Leucogyrophana mollusca]|uniref:Uncharacterized protein n=1 Tax=Leucogyrophana mollusca TaxID=85980 RepID=A0ACB8BSW3_9AGAM|nr:hypothetical protein BV22DRAFT_1083499 [Leucogyrophana mollusca]
MSSPEPEASSTKKSTKDKSKDKKKDKASNPPAVVVTEHGKNEGENPHWAYKPPEGAVLLDHTIDRDDFEWDTIKKDEDLELWVVRVPDSLKVKHLDGLQIDEPTSSRSARVGTLTKKNMTFDIWSVADDDEDTVGGEELRGLSCLLPRRKKQCKLYTAPKPIARHIVISAPPVTPSEHEHITHQNPPRPSYPKEVLKHCFIPYGAQQESAAALPTADDVEMDDPTPEGKSTPAGKGKEHKTKESKGNKRRIEGETPKKAKKPKIAG